MLRGVLVITAVLSAFPVGWLLAYLCREELVAGRKYFVYILILCLLGIFILLFIKVDNWLEMALGLVYLIIISLIGLKLSYREGFTR